MIEISIPGGERLRLKYLVLDFNGTIALDGRLIEGVRERVEILSRDLKIYVLTADTHGNVEKEVGALPVEIAIIGEEAQDIAKLKFIEKLGCNGCVCIGNGRNDALMLKESALGIAVLQSEGCALNAFSGAKVITSSILHALDLLLHPLRLIATLRS